jgi:hypothetical protein
MKYLIKFLIILTLLIMTAIYSFAATYYVDATNGNDANDGSQNNPFKTILAARQPAWNTAGGDTINIAAGTYTENIQTQAGDNGIKIIGTSRDTTVLNGWIITEAASGLTSLEVKNLTINGANSGVSISIRDGISGISISNCKITGYTGNGIEMYESSANITISDNIIYPSSTPKNTTGIYAGNFMGVNNPTINNVTIENNIIYNNLGKGVHIDNSAVNNLAIKNNTLSGNGDGLTFGNQNINASIKNNIIANNTIGITKGTKAVLTLSYNNVYGNTTLNYAVGVSVGTGDISFDPVFKDAANGNFSLKEFSACIDAGESGADIGASSFTGTKRTTIYVDDSGGKDYTTLTSASKAVGAAYTISVAAGTYNKTLGETFPITISSSSVTFSGEGSSSTYIVGDKSDAVDIIHVTGSSCIIEKLNVTGAGESGNFKADISVAATGVTVRDNITSEGDIGIFFRKGANNGSVLNNIVYCNNTKTGDGIGASEATGLNFTNNTIYNRKGGILSNFSAAVTLKNSIIVNCTTGMSVLSSGTITESYNNLYNNTTDRKNNDTNLTFSAGTGDVSVDPQFTNAPTDFTLKSASALIDVGDPASTFSNEKTSRAIEMGAFGNTDKAAVSPAKEFYVNIGSGNNSNDGLQSYSPFKTITYALTKAVVSGDIINAVAGTYNKAAGETFPLSIPRNLTLKGAGASTTIIEIPTDVGAGINLASTITSLTIEGFTFKASGQTTIPLQFTDFAGNSSGIIVRNNIFNGQGTGNIGIEFAPASGTISSNTISGFKNNVAIHISQGGNATPSAITVNVSNNTLDNNKTGILIADDQPNKKPTVSIKNNNITNDTTGISRASSNVSVSSSYNNLWNNTNNRSGIDSGTGDISIDPQYYGDALIPRNQAFKTSGEGGTYIGASSPSGSIIYVETNGNDANSGASSSAALKTFKAAIDKAISGDTIKVGNGRYIENLSISKSLILEGTSAEETVLEGSLDMVDGADWTIIKSFKIRALNSDHAIKAEGASNVLKNIKISENTIESESDIDNGIIFRNISNGEITKNVIRKFRKRGIKVLKTTASVRENIFQEVKGASGDAVAVESAEESTVTNSTNGIEDNDTGSSVDSSSNGSSSSSDNRRNKTDYGGKAAKGQDDTSDKTNDTPKVRRIIFVDDNGSTRKKDFVNANKIRKLIIKTANALNEEVNSSATIGLISSSGKFYSDENGLNAINSIILNNTGTTTFYYLNSTSTDSDVVTASESPDQGWDDAILTMSIITPQTVSGTASTVLNWPNPFNPDKDTVKIQYDLADDKNVSVNIYDLTMNLVWKRDFAAGSDGGTSSKKNEISWDGRTDFGDICANGIYLVMVIDSNGKKLLAKGKIAILK